MKPSPYAAHAIIQLRKNAEPWKANRCGADARNGILREIKREYGQ